MAKKDIYAEITDRLISEIEAGQIPWHRPWFGCGDAWSRSSGKPYQGINAFLPPGEYATFHQIAQAGGKVKKGAKSYTVVFKSTVLIDDPEAEDSKRRVFTQKYFNVFRIGDQTENIEPTKKFEPSHDCAPIEAAEKIITAYTDAPTIAPQPSDKAYYTESADKVVLPELKQFTKKEEYYSTLFHELIHSTGAKKRLNRDSLRNYHSGINPTRPQEELIAELGAALLCGECGINSKGSEKNSAAYLQSWLAALKNDKKYIFTALAAARKAIDHIKGETKCI